MRTITDYRNDVTGELAPPHVLGTDERGRRLYGRVDGWTPVDATGREVAVEYDRDGNMTAA